MNEAQVLINDPKYYINEYFSGLRNKIDLTKENYVKMVHFICHSFLQRQRTLIFHL